jgi:hypothetical protein
MAPLVQAAETRAAKDGETLTVRPRASADQDATTAISR